VYPVTTTSDVRMITVDREMINPATQVTGASKVMATPMPAKTAMRTGRIRPVPTVGTRRTCSPRVGITRPRTATAVTPRTRGTTSVQPGVLT
jgi:hypothetical protein